MNEPTWLFSGGHVASGLGAENGEVHVGFAAVDDGVGVLARSLGGAAVTHDDLWTQTNQIQTHF